MDDEGLYVHHWVNEPAVKLYTRWDAMNGERFAVGSIFAKESFQVHASGAVTPGPLSLMEKVKSGERGAWVFTKVSADGRYQRTNGPESAKTAHCFDCHGQMLKGHDGAFFPPKKYRVNAMR